MKKAVKLLFLLLALSMLLSLAACGDKEPPAAPVLDPQPAAADPQPAADPADEPEAPAEPEPEAEPEDTRLDYGWIKFEMPEGYFDRNESDYYLGLESTENSKHVIKVACSSVYSGKTVADMAAKEADSSDRYTLGETVTAFGRDWYTVDFTFNGNPSVMLFTEAYEGYMIKVTVYEMGVDDPAVQTILRSVEVFPTP